MKIFIQHAPISIAMFDRDMNYLVMSKRWYMDYGQGFGDLTGLNHYDVHPDLPDEWKNVHRRAIAGEAARNDEDMWLQADGSRHWLSWSVDPWSNENGAIGGIVISSENITARKEAEVAIRSRDEFKEVVLNSVAANIAVVDDNGFILAVNERWRRFSLNNSREPGKPTPHTDVGTNYFSVLDGLADMAEIRQGIRSVADRRLPSYDIEYPCHSPEQQRWFHMSVTPFGESGQGAVIAHTDISQRKKAEVDLAAMRANMQEIMCWQVARHTVAAIAHELNQPLASVSALSTTLRLLLADGNVPAEQLEQTAHRMALESQRAGNTVHQLMDSLHKPKVTVEATSVSDLISRVAQSARSLAGPAYTIEIQSPPNLPPVLANSLQIEKVLHNLIGNSVDAMRDAAMATGRILIKTGTTANANEVWVAVEDEGPGVGSALASQLFQPFITSKATGLGMGLTISYSLIEAHGGRLCLEEHDGPGAVFKFTLPVAR